MDDKYVLKLGPKLRIVPSQLLDNLTPSQAMMIGFSCIEEQRKQLLLDAKKGDKFFYGRKIVDALEISITKLEETIPDLRIQAKQIIFGKVRDVN